MLLLIFRCIHAQTAQPDGNLAISLSVFYASFLVAMYSGGGAEGYNVGLHDQNFSESRPGKVNI